MNGKVASDVHNKTVGWRIRAQQLKRNTPRQGGHKRQHSADRNARQVDGKQQSHCEAEVFLLYIIESQVLPKRLLASEGR